MLGWGESRQQRHRQRDRALDGCTPAASNVFSNQTSSAVSSNSNWLLCFETMTCFVRTASVAVLLTEQPHQRSLKNLNHRFDLNSKLAAVVSVGPAPEAGPQVVCPAVARRSSVHAVSLQSERQGNSVRIHATPLHGEQVPHPPSPWARRTAAVGRRRTGARTRRRSAMQLRPRLLQPRRRPEGPVAA